MKRGLLLFALVLTVLLGVSGIASASDPDGNHDHYLFLAGVEPVEGPDMAVAPNGATLTLTGSGEFTAGPGKSASGGGSFTITDASGATVASGSWSVLGVLGFVSYGSGAPQGLPDVFGGVVKLRVSLSGVGEGVLTIDCLLGSPPAGAEEGITLNLGEGWNFNDSVHGETVFIPA